MTDHPPEVQALLEIAVGVAMNDEPFVQYLTGRYPDPAEFAQVATAHALVHGLHHAWCAGKADAAKELCERTHAEFTRLSVVNKGSPEA